MTRLARLLTIGMVAAAPGLAHAGSYVFTPFDVPGARQLYPTAINRHGEAVGDYQDQQSLNTYAFVVSNSVVTVLSGLPGAVLKAINEHGIAVGFAGSGLLVYDVRDGSNRVLLPRFTSPEAVGIDSANDILAAILVGAPHCIAMPLLLSDGATLKLRPPGRAGATPIAINASGVVLSTVGASGFLYSGGGFTTIPKPFEGTALPYHSPVYTFLSDTGAAGGYAFRDFYGKIPQIGFVYRNNAFDPVIFPGAYMTKAVGALDDGTVVGSYLTPFPHVGHGFIESTAGVYSSVDVPGAVSTTIVAASGDGSLLGTYFDASGTQHGFTAACAPDQRPCTH